MDATMFFLAEAAAAERGGAEGRPAPPPRRLRPGWIVFTFFLI